MSEIIATFSAGDEVPDWLLNMEATAASDGKAVIVFASDVVVVHAFRKYHIVASNNGRPPFYVNGNGTSLAIAAATRTVVIPTAFQIMRGEE